MTKVAVIGAGTMGNGIAHVFAQHEWDTTLIDVRPEALEKGLATIKGNLERQVKKGTLAAEAPAAILGRIKPASSLDAAKGRVADRRSGNRESRAQAPDFPDARRRGGRGAILATNTSSISITEIAASTKRPDKVVGMHFMNPVPLMQLVEVIRGHATTDETTQAVLGIAKALGKTPVEVNDYPGFVANRILMPMINEAVYCVMEGVRDARSDRHRHEARHESPDGAAHAGGLHRSRRLPRDSRSDAQGTGRSRSTGPVRCSGGWWRRAPGRKTGRASTATS
jgi:3-hydroxybutyryl-CoA dehydrogenase